MDLRQQLLVIFQSEHAEHVEHIRSIVSLLENVQGPAAGPGLDEAFRRAHTLKGAARAVDLRTVEGIAHRLETLLSRVRDGKVRLDRRAAGIINQALDCSEECIASDPGFPVRWNEAAQAIDELLAGETEDLSGPAPLEAAADSPRNQPVGTGAQIEMVRVSADSLDGLLRSSGQIAAEAPRQNRITRELGALSRRMQELQGAVDRIYGGQASQLAPLSAHVRSAANQLRVIAAEQSQSAWTLLRSAERLREDAGAARIVRAESLVVGFRKMVRDLAHDQAKKVQFRVTGSEIRADRAILQALKDPLMHLLRNAVSHGIETPRERRAKDKPDEGTIALHIALERGRLILAVEDDGSGVDVEAVTRAAVDKGLIDQEEVSRRSPEELARLIFQPGFSTAAGLTDLSGRGFGLSVVQEAVRRLQGDLDLGRIRSGMRVILSVPLSASASHLLLVSCQEQTFGIPTHAIEHVNRIRIGELARAQGKPMIRVAGRQVPVFGLSGLLGLSNPDSKPAPDVLRVVALKSGERSAAVAVDAFLGERNAHLQELGLPGLPRYVAGGVIGDDGAALVVLNPAALVDLCFEQRAPVFPAASLPRKEVSPRILIVDDSITTRSLERSILDAHGFRTSVAVNGVEALEILRNEGADLVLTDLEMPQMDGFGLITAIRSDKKLKNIPVIVVSSRGGVADEKQGLLLGADAYVIKSKFDQVELVQTIRRAL